MTVKRYAKAIAVVLLVIVGGVDAVFADQRVDVALGKSRPLSSSGVLNQSRIDTGGCPNRPLSSSEVIAILEKNLPAQQTASVGGAEQLAENANGTLVLGGRRIAKAELALRVRDYLTPTEAEVKQLFDFVVGSMHIKNNALYEKVMKDTQLVYSNKINVVNSFANRTPLICVLGGDARFSRLVGLAVAACKDDSNAAARFIGALTPEACGVLGEEGSLELMAKANILYAFADEEALLKARGVSAGYLLFTIAHEAGHLSMAHVLSPDYLHKPFEISRNQEREADSFASSVIASCPFGEYIFTGRLFELYARACCERGRRETTHPLSSERLQNLIKENPALAASFGIRADMFKDGDEE